jgi:hypothetical protein
MGSVWHKREGHGGLGALTAMDPCGYLVVACMVGLAAAAVGILALCSLLALVPRWKVQLTRPKCIKVCFIWQSACTCRVAEQSAFVLDSCWEEF